MKKKATTTAVGLLILLLILAVSASFSLWQNNQIIIQTYLLQALQRKTENLKEENAVLERNFLRENSLSNLQDLVQNMDMEKAERATFIEVTDGVVVTVTR